MAYAIVATISNDKSSPETNWY